MPAQDHESLPSRSRAVMSSGWAARVLSDENLALLALASVMATAAPFAFDNTPRLQSWVWAVDVVALAAFVAEYALALLRAPDRREFVRDPWRALDAVVIVTLAVSLLPAAAAALGASPLLRLIRFARLALLGTRSGARLVLQPEMAVADDGVESGAESAAFALQRGAQPPLVPVDWGEVLRRIGSEQEDWLYVRGLGEAELKQIAQRLGVPEPLLGERLLQASFPQLDRMQRFVTLFLWYPMLKPGPVRGGLAEATLTRTGVLLVGAGRNVAVLVRRPSDLLDRLQARLDEFDDSVPTLVGATHALLREVVRAWLRVAEDLELRLERLEADELALGDQVFLQRAFRLRRELTHARTTLRHLARVTEEMHNQPLAINGFDAVEQPLFGLLASEAMDIHERVETVSTNLAALTDMRLNVSSFQMNKVMRILAVLTTLALIPSVVGGMLGMNLLDAPWSLRLPEVGFWVTCAMVLSVYVFAVRGWLR